MLLFWFIWPISETTEQEDATSDGLFSLRHSALLEQEEIKGKNIPLKLKSDSIQPLLNCYGSFCLTVNAVPLLGEETVAEKQNKITHNCVEPCQIWLSQCRLKRHSFSDFPVRSQLVFLWIFLLHGNEAEVLRERQMVRSNVIYPNVHVRQRAFWHTSWAES